MSPRELASIIDHTLLKPETSVDQIEQLCAEALRFGFCSVCVNPVYVRASAERLAGTGVAVVCVVGFPLGTNTATAKSDETQQAIDDGALEIDLVLHVGSLIAGQFRQVRDDIARVADMVHAASAAHLIKVILETAALSEEQIASGCRCCAEAQVDYVKTSTGFHPAGGATPEAVRMVKRYVAPIKVKAAGGIHDLRTTLAMIDAGADRIGTSSGVAIVGEMASAHPGAK